MLITIITLNGRAFRFEADEVDIIDDRYVFSYSGYTVASFDVKNIAGYYSESCEEEDDE